MLILQNISIHLNKDNREILSGFSLILRKGDKAAIIGEEGNGKSTLLRLIHDPESVSGYAGYSGELNRQGLRTGYLAQELDAGALELTVYEYLAGAEGFFDASPKELGDIALGLGCPVEFFYSDQPVKTLSGGEKVKLQLSAIIVGKPDVILLDEPSNDIDIGTLEWLERFIRECEKPVLFISHDEILLENTANVIVHIEQVRRKTVARASVLRCGYREYVDKRLYGIERQTRIARKEKAEYDKQAERFRQIYQKVEHEQNAISRQDPAGGRLLKKKMKSLKSLENKLDGKEAGLTQLPDFEEAIVPAFPADVGVPNGKTVLELCLDSLKIGERELARGIRLTVTGPQKICIIGKNGAGKTTLLRHIAGELLPRRDIRAYYMPQDYFETLGTSVSPVEFLAPGGSKESVTTARTYLGSMRYTAEEMLHPAKDLSGGQKAKLLFLKMILERHNVLLLDEPTRNFSPLSAPVIRGILQGFGGTIISISHDRKYIAEVCGTVYELTDEGLNKVEIL